METLFPPIVSEADIPAIPGLQYIPDYISEDEERKLVEAIDRLPWNTSWQRRRQPYGAAYGESGTGAAIPDWGMELARRMHAENISEEPFDQMLVNEYLPGQGIAFHADYKPFARTVASLSLLSSYVMDFRNRSLNRQERLLLERRSLLILSDDARYVWEHGIAPRKRDEWHGMRLERGRRLSVTFRTLEKRRSKVAKNNFPKS